MSDSAHRPIVLSLIPTGNSSFTRYMIADQFLRYWNGEGWTEQEDAKSARRYADPNDACQEIQRILRQDHSHLPVKRFVAPVTIDLYSEEEIDIHILRDWLTKVSKLLVDSPKYGNGPMEGTLGLCKIDWSLLREVQ